MILYAKFGEHQPLNRQSETYARCALYRSASAGGGCKPFCRRNRSHFRTFGRAVGREARSAALRGYRRTPIAAGADEGILL
jgi:hypothetical protein